MKAYQYSKSSNQERIGTWKLKSPLFIKKNLMKKLKGRDVCQKTLTSQAVK
jgi:hypothetical protein